MNYLRIPALLLVVLVLFCVAAMPVVAAEGEFRENTIDMVILLDRSGSMENNDPNGISVAAASFVIEQLGLANEKNRVAVIPFANEASLLGHPTAANPPADALQTASGGLINLLAAGISQGRYPGVDSGRLELLRAQMKPAGFTYLAKALELARRILEKSPSGIQRTILLISDGLPEINKNARDKELEALLGQDKVNDTHYRQFILSTVAPALGRTGITLLPVAFAAKKDTKEYMMELKKAANGSIGIIEADPNTIIRELREKIPSSSRHISLRHREQFTTQSHGKIEVKVPEVATQTRFAISYQSPTPSQRPQLRVYRNGALLPESATILRHELKKKNGAVIYQSVTIIDPAQASGTFQVELTNVQGSGGIAESSLYVDIRSRVYAVPEFLQQPRAKNRLDVKYTLFDGKSASAPTVLKIVSGEVKIWKQGTDSPALLLPKEDQNSLLASLEEGVPTDGNYNLDARLCFLNCDQEREQQIAVRIGYDVQIQPGVEPKLWIQRTAARGEEANLSINLPPLGELFSVETSAYILRTTHDGPLEGIRLKIEPFRHEGSAEELVSGGANWARVTVSGGTSEVRGNIFKNGAPIRLAVAIPDGQSLDSKPDGRYVSSVVVLNGNTPAYTVPLSINIQVPRFIDDKKQINTPYNPEVRFKKIEKVLHWPTRWPSQFKIRCWSTTLAGTSAKGSFTSGETAGLRLNEKGEPGDKVDAVKFDCAKEPVAIPGKNKQFPGKVIASVKIEDNSLNGESFTNMLYLGGAKHRTAPVELVVRLQYWPKLYLMLAYLVMAGIAGYLFLQYRALNRFRGLFEGAQGNISVSEGTPKSLPLTYRTTGDLGQFSYNGSSLENFGDIDNRSISFTVPSAAIGTYQDSDQNSISIGQDFDYFPQTADRISLSHGTRRFELIIRQASFDQLSYRVSRSYFGNGSRRYLYLAPACLLGLTALFGFVSPYLLLQLCELLANVLPSF